MPPSQLRRKLQQCLGGPWPSPCSLRPEAGKTIRKDGYRIEPVTYEVEPGDFAHHIEPGAGHVLSEKMWAKTKAFFKKHLRV